MPLSEFYKSIRSKLGHDLLLLPGVCALVFNPRGEILLQKRSDTGKWAVIGGMLDPGEEPADAVIREVREETAIEAIPQRITGVYATPIITYANGDRAQFIITTFLCNAGDAEPRVNDDESLEVRYFPLSNLPELGPQHRLRIQHALANNPGAFFHVGNA